MSQSPTAVKPPMQRRCGECTACCKLLPIHADERDRTPEKRILLAEMGRIPDFEKPAGKRCPYQRHGKGCTIYDRRPLSCAVWNCRWLVNNDCDDQSRPDRSHFVLDLMPDYITVVEEDGRRTNVEAVQVWIDPGFPDAYRDPALRAYLARRGEEGIVGLIRLSASDGLVLIPPAMTSDGRWIEKSSDLRHERPTRDEGYVADVFTGIASATHKAKWT